MQLNMEKCSVLITSKVHTHSFLGYKTYLKQKAIILYNNNNNNNTNNNNIYLKSNIQCT